MDRFNNKWRKINHLNDKIFYTGLLANHPSITEYEAVGIMEAYKKKMET